MNDDLAQIISPTKVGPAFMNNMACKLRIDDNLKVIAHTLLTEVVHKLKRPVTAFITTVNEMCDAAEHCADIESTKAEMLNYLWSSYGLRDDADETFVKARDNCLLARDTAKKNTPRPVVPTQGEFKTVLNASTISTQPYLH
jgi:hypothetical protein